MNAWAPLEFASGKSTLVPVKCLREGFGTENCNVIF